MKDEPPKKSQREKAVLEGASFLIQLIEQNKNFVQLRGGVNGKQSLKPFFDPWDPGLTQSKL